MRLFRKYKFLMFLDAADFSTPTKYFIVAIREWGERAYLSVRLLMPPLKGFPPPPNAIAKPTESESMRNRSGCCNWSMQPAHQRGK